MAANPVVPSPSLQLDIKKSGDTATVLCCGRVVTDTTLILQMEVRQLLNQPEFKTIALDMSDVNSMDSSGLGALVGLLVSSKRAGKKLQLLNLKDRIRELLRISNLLNIFEGYGESL
jgi:anti-sigma B factor antagonist